MRKFCYKCVKMLPDLLFKDDSQICIRCGNNKIHSDFFRLFSKANDESILKRKSQYEVISGRRTKNMNFPDVNRLFENEKEFVPFIYNEKSVVNSRGFWQMYLYSEVKYRDLFKCHYCGEFADTVDHIVPLSRNGEESITNILACCNLCNELKGNYDYNYFLRNRERLLKKRYDGSAVDKRVLKSVTKASGINVSDNHIKFNNWKIKQDNKTKKERNLKWR